MLPKKEATVVNRISKETQAELIGAIRERYRYSSKRQKSKILDEFSALTGFHRKHAIRLIREQGDGIGKKKEYGHAIYNHAVKD